MRSARPSGSRRGVSPLVGEVILVAICVIMSGVILVAAGAIAPDNTPAPQMAFSKAVKEDGHAKLVFAGTVPGTEFIQFKLVVYSPGSLVPMDATFNGAVSYQLNDTLTLHLVDLGNDGDVSSGDYLVVESSGTMESGEWDYYMIYLSDGSATASASVLM